MKIEDIKIKEWKMFSHLSTDMMFLSKHKGIFSCEGYLNDKTVVREFSTKKLKNCDFPDESKLIWYLEDKEITFQTLIELVKFYVKDLEE